MTPQDTGLLHFPQKCLCRIPFHGLDPCSSWEWIPCFPVLVTRTVAAGPWTNGVLRAHLVWNKVEVLTPIPFFFWGDGDVLASLNPQNTRKDGGSVVQFICSTNVLGAFHTVEVSGVRIQCWIRQTQFLPESHLQASWWRHARTKMYEKWYPLKERK